MKVIIMAGGKGEKIWPYNEIRNKCMIPVSNKPIVQYLVDGLLENNVDEIFIVGSMFTEEMSHHFRHNKKVHVIRTQKTNGNAETLLHFMCNEDFVIIYGDCIISGSDIKQLLESQDYTYAKTYLSAA